MSSDTVSIHVGEMHERKGEDGRIYLTGDLGFARLVLVKSERRAEDDSEVWDVHVQRKRDWHHPNMSEYRLPDML